MPAQAGDAEAEGRKAPRDDGGQALVEYALILLFVVLVTVTMVARLGPEVRGFYQHAVDCLTTPTSC